MNGATVTGWGEWDGAVHLLSAPCITALTAPYIDVDAQEVRWHELIETSRPWSTGERLLVDAALDLWNADAGVNLYELVNRLDRDNFTRVLDAMRLARGRS